MKNSAIQVTLGLTSSQYAISLNLSSRGGIGNSPCSTGPCLGMEVMTMLRSLFSSYRSKDLFQSTTIPLMHILLVSMTLIEVLNPPNHLNDDEFSKVTNRMSKNWK